MCHKNKEEQKFQCGMHTGTAEENNRKFGKCPWSQKKMMQEQETPKFEKFPFGHHGHHHHHHRGHHHHCSPPPPPPTHCHRSHYFSHFHGPPPQRHHCGTPIIMSPSFSHYYYEAMKD